MFQDVLHQEQRALEVVARKLAGEPEAIERACAALLSAVGRQGERRLVVSGIGKAGLIARKVAATLSSTGTAAAFLHPVEALHGDLGFVKPEDCGLLLSYSGETVELVRLGQEMRRLGCPLVAITRSRESTLGKLVGACIETGVVPEACYLGLAPSSSTTVMLAIGDALALAVAKARGFRVEDFARNHPAGSLGLRFRFVQDLMRTGGRLVCVQAGTRVGEAVSAVSKAKTGAAVVIRENGTLLGIFTDGDLRRALLRGGFVLGQEVGLFSSIPCKSIHSDASVEEALKLFHNTRTEDLPVVDRISGKVVGMLCLKDIAVF